MAKRIVPEQKKIKARSHRAARSSSGTIAKPSASTVYKDFSIYSGKKAPSWHPVKKMRYVFYRMIYGCTITDAVHEIRWNVAEFWHLVDLKRHGPFRLEYTRAKTLQGRAFADSVQTIAEGRDRITRRSMKKIEQLIRRGLRKVKKQKSAFAAEAVLQSVLAQIDVNENRILSRNRVQIDAAKWLAEAVNPAEYGKKTSVALGSGSGDGDGKTARPIVIQFVGRDGKVIDL